MTSWTIAPDGEHLLRDGRDDMLLLDTLWAALHRADEEEFLQVLDTRAEQGFSGVMMSALPIAHDRSGDMHDPLRRRPGREADGSLDPDWVARARRMVAAVTARGLTPFIVLQWVDYVPGTWASLEHPDVALDDETTRAYVTELVQALADHDPIWCLSGDDVFTSTAARERYRLIHDVVRGLDPNALVAVHTGGWVNLPDEVRELADVVGFQSGHDGANWAENPASWNHYLDSLPGPRGVRMNLEPCYEGHGFDGGTGRYTARDVRLASWRSVLSGAGAGLGYGAHGLWSWHHRGEAFSSEDWSGMPFDAMTALTFPGADDVGYLRSLVLQHRLWRLRDRSDLVVRDRSGIRVGADRSLDVMAVHSPHAFSFEVQVDAVDVDVRGYDLQSRAEVEVARSVGGSGRLVIDTPAAFADHLYVITRR